ncbi:aminodeoxychorismate synthase component I, partial [Bacillus vallismortis]|nr:aminodeoxychorismate synthase component I [Bacillus vallismortis]
RGGIYSIAGLDPIATLKGKDGMTNIKHGDEILFKEGDPLRAFHIWFKTLETETNHELPDFQGGAIGFLSYDYARYIENFKMLSLDD